MILLFGCFPVSPVLAQENPARFLEVTEWVGRFTHRIQDAGREEYDRDDETCTATWNIEERVEITCNLRLLPGHLPDHRFWFSDRNTSQEVQLRESLTEVCVSPPPESHVSIMEWNSRPAPEVVPTGFSVEIDTRNQKYTLGFPVGTSIAVILSMSFPGLGVPPIEVPMTLLFSQEVQVTRPLPGLGMQLMGSERWPLKEARFATSLPSYLLQTPNQTAGLFSNCRRFQMNRGFA
jgi:hypothetical protein